MLNFEFLEILRTELAAECGIALTPEIPPFYPETPPQGMKGDIALNCFKMARFFKDKPENIALKVKTILSSRDEITFAESIKGFVNLEIKPEYLHRTVNSDIEKLIKSAEVPENEKKRIVVEYSAPNTNKPMHLGHVRNNTLGLAVTSLLKKTGHHVFSVNLINDRGIHICKSMIAYQRFGNGETPQSSKMKGDHLVGKYYVRFDQELKKQIEALKVENPVLRDSDDEELFPKTEVGTAAQEMLVKWENNDHETVSLWKKMNSWVIEGFHETYRRMGVSFDKIYLESDTYLLGKDIVAEGLRKGIFQKRDDGAVFIDLEKEGFGKKVLLRADGTSVYITQDLGTTVEKNKDFSPDSQIWIVGDEQIHHFKILFATLAKLGCKWAGNLFHLAYGMVTLPSGKMKSREGTVVDADDLFDQMFSLAKEACSERYGENPPADLDERCERIGMGALKFMLLKFNPKTTMLFDPGASLKFEGDTGPYVQYACTRVNSIEKKATAESIPLDSPADWSLLVEKLEKELTVKMFFYPRILGEAAEKLDASILVNYLLDLAKSFSRFYKEFSVLSAENDALRNARLKLCLNTRKILQDGLATLTIKVPEAM